MVKIHTLDTGVKKGVSNIAGIPLYIPLIVGGVFFWMVLTLAEKKSDKTYNYTRFVENLESGNLPTQKSGLSQYFKPFLQTTQNRIRLSKNVEEDLERKFKEAAWNMTPQQFYTTKILYPVVFVIMFLLMGVFVGGDYIPSVIFYILAAVSSLTYYYPNYILKNKLKNAEAMRRFELPNFLTPLGLMMYSYTPFQAVKKSLKFAGPYLRPYVEKLVIEMEMYPSSTKPFRRFADDLGIPEAQTFMTALQQAINTDPSKSRNIIQSQIEMMRKLREENYMQIIEMRPLAMNKYNFMLIGCILIIPVFILINVLTNMANNL